MPTYLKSIRHVAAAGLPILGAVTAPSTLNVSDIVSIKSVASTIAYGAMSYYDGNSSTTRSSLGDLNDPYYWWEAGAMWGALVDYYHYTGDPTYNDNLIAALTSPLQLGAGLDYMPTNHAFEEGNDDLGFWGYVVLAAAEANLPQPDETVPSWLQLAENVFNSLVSRWDASTCGGGLLWQIYAGNPNGMTYKNSVSNGGLFQVAARLYRATGNSTYLAWATTVYDWTAAVGLVDASFYVYDGTQITTGCRDINRACFTYSHGIYMYGAAVLANATGNATWASRTAGFVAALDGRFFSPRANATGIMYEPACEPPNTCDTDMRDHKATLARFMAKTAVMVPATGPAIWPLLRASAAAAAQTCTGGGSGRACGERWYLAGFDGEPGLGQELCALETVQGLLAAEAEPPLRGDQIKVVRDTPWDPPAPPAPSAPAPPPAAPAPPTETGDGENSAGWGRRADLGAAAIAGVGGAMAMMHWAA